MLRSVAVRQLRNTEGADMRVVPGQPGEIANTQDSNTSDFGRHHPVPHAILSVNQASPSACRLLLWQPEELLQVREIVVRAISRTNGSRCIPTRVTIPPPPCALAAYALKPKGMAYQKT